MKNSIKILLIYVMALSVISCQDDFEKLSRNNWSPELAIPLVDAKFNIERVLKNSENLGTITEGGGNIVTVVYAGEIFNFTAPELFKLEDFGMDIALISGEFKLPQTEMLLKHMDLSQGSLEILVNGNISQTTEVVLKMPTTKKNGASLNHKFSMTSNSYSETIDLTGYKFDLSGGQGNQSNVINIGFESHTLAGDTVPLNQFIVKFSNLKFDFLGGYLGAADFGDFQDSLQVPVFDNFKSGTFALTDPRFNLIFESSFGMPVQLVFDKFVGEGEGGVSSLDITNDGILVNAPADTIGKKTEITENDINKSNSNLSDFISVNPRSILFNFHVEANKSGDTNAYNFIYSDSRIKGTLDLSLPLHGRLDSVVYEDEYDFETQDLSNVDRAEIRLWVNNFFPVGVYMQLYFMDVEGGIVDSLMTDNSIIFKEAMTNAEGFAVNGSIEESIFILNRQRFNEIQKRATKIKLRAMMLSDDAKNKSIKISSKDYFHLKLGILAKVHE